MLRLNNKGQSLVMFIVLIPIVLLVFTLVYDVGNAIYEKERLSNTNYMTIEYALDNINNVNENDLIELIMKNNSSLYLQTGANLVKKFKSVGIMAGASTPQKSVEEIVDIIKKTC